MRRGGSDEIAADQEAAGYGDVGGLDHDIRARNVAVAERGFQRDAGRGAARRQDPARPGYVAEADGRGACQRMAAAQDDRQHVLDHDLGGQAGHVVGRAQAAEQEVDVAGAQQGRKMLERALDRADPDIGIGAGQRDDGTRQQPVPSERQGADHHAAGNAALQRGDLGLGMAQLGERAPHLRRQHQAERIGRDAGRRARDEGQADALLDLPQHLADRRLGNAETFGDRAHVALGDQIDEDRQALPAERQREDRGMVVPAPLRAGGPDLRADLIAGDLHGGEGGLHPFHQGSAELGQQHAMGAALEQRHFERAFELLDRAGDGRLGPMQFLARPDHAAGAGDGQEGAQIFGIDDKRVMAEGRPAFLGHISVLGLGMRSFNCRRRGPPAHYSGNAKVGAATSAKLDRNTS